MVFSSMIFLWIFLPVVLVGNIILDVCLHQRRLSNLFLLLFSLCFYAWGEPVYVLLMMVSIFVNWFLGLQLGKRKQKWILVLDIAVNIGLLIIFKYTGFIARSINAILGIISPAVQLPVPVISLPIGISFFTFQALSYVIDVYRREVEPQKSLYKVALYISFFPQLIAGPIVRYHDIAEEIDGRKVTRTDLSLGIRRFLYGVAKKVLIANIMAKGVDTLYAMELQDLTGMTAWIAAVMYALQIYYDFSGYSDMAIGLGRMFGFHFMENFNYPYLSASIGEFWRRWHISLGTWFREYVYIPLGGNRISLGRTRLNLFIVFLLTGIWHGASLNYLLWGVYYGIFIIAERGSLGKFLSKHRWVGWIYSIIIVLLGWVLFRLEDLHQAVSVLGIMVTPWAHTVSRYALGEVITPQMLLVLVIGIIGMGPIQKLGEKTGLDRLWKNSIVEAL
ncbi:MAG: MBOAT family protein, partial [Clostridia bacterium]|nr:MBOAT family protein [Clostridia bacterium]